MNWKRGWCGFYMRMEITAHDGSDRTASIQRLLRFNGQDEVADDGLHVATVIKYRGPDLGRKPQILDSFRQIRLKFGPNLNHGQGHHIKFCSRSN